MIPVSTNSMEERTTTVFSLGPVDMSRTGAYRFLNPITGKVVFRFQFTVIPLQSYHIALMKALVACNPSNG